MNTKLKNLIVIFAFIITTGTLAGCNTTTTNEMQSSLPENEEVLLVKSSSPYGFANLINDPTPSDEVVLKVKLHFPEHVTKDEKLPTMVLVHGSGGLMAKHEQWLSLFHEMGMVTVVTDHFEPRGISSSVGNQTRVTGPMMTADALHILNALAIHPRIDPNRIGIMGNSKGGGVAASVSWEPIRSAVSGENKFAAQIPLYPPCVFWENKTFTNMPTMIMIGDKDNYTGVSQCVESANELKKSGYANLEIKLYPDAYHGFDDSRGIRTSKHGFSALNCGFLVTVNGASIEANSNISLDDKISRRKALGSCATRGVTLGGNHVMPKAKTLPSFWVTFWMQNEGDNQLSHIKGLK